ncbi:hypothetical protein CN151_24810 [Sinorhizobium meliloti]|nr:hypothetical protein CN151_24810 [Sinorhizobium meliloti]RVM88670.1 hypothetical protein CN119_26675 [Sinorhizobium meliloti]RVN03751.1 hypothetical protein CN112_26650 [Sinorhizobium meliloti]
MPARFSQLRAKLGLAPEALSRASSALRHGVTSFGESRPRRLRLADLLTGCVRQVLQNWAVMRAGHAA